MIRSFPTGIVRGVLGHRVVLADDHPVYRQGLAKLLTESGVDVVAEAGNGWAALRAVASTSPDVVVLDLKMPGLSGAEVARRLTSCDPPHRVLAISVHASKSDVTSALRAGASGYILKERPVEEVVAGIGAVAVGESLFSPRIGAMLLRRIGEREGGLGEIPVSLSARQREVLTLAIESGSNEKTGEGRWIDSRTGRPHVSHIPAKPRVDGPLRAAMRAVRGSLV
jgi:DNA-binding NarL/FixJ family response regulator